jgi:hypothetical protein
MTKSKEEQIFIGIDNERVELLGADKEAFLVDQAQMKAERTLLEAEYKAKQDSRESAIKKLAEIAGLTKDELNAIL